MKKVILLFSVALLMAVATLAAPVTLVKGGKSVAEIVIDKNANQSAKLAAKDLQSYLKKISGAELAIVNVPTSGAKNHIYVGANDLTKALGFKPAKFNNSGFEVIAKDNYVILSGTDRLQKRPSFISDLKSWQTFCGQKFGIEFTSSLGYFNASLGIYNTDDTGTWYAAAELLEQIGVRFYAPYENGTVIPEMKDVSVAEQNLKSEAAFALRDFYYGPGDPGGIAWFKRLKAGNYSLIINNHLTYDIFSSQEQQKLHPEYLACDAEGKPYPGYPAGYGMPRFGNQDFRRASIIYMNKVFDALPDVSAIAMGQPDGGIILDDRDIKLYGKDGESLAQRISNCFWEYTVYMAKELKKSHPDKFLLYLIYGEGVRMVPTNLKSDDPDNIILAFAQPYSAYRVLNFTNREALAERKNWFSSVKQRGKSPVWDYYLYYRFTDFPRFPVFFTDSLQVEMKEMQPYGMGKFMEIPLAAQSNGVAQTGGMDDVGLHVGEPALMHLMLYWQSKLLWNPNLDRKAMLEEYYKLYFGPAAAEMKEFHEFAEEVWIRQESRSVTLSTGFLKEKDSEKFFKILASARAKAGKNTVYEKRIADMETAYEPLKKLFANLQRRGPNIRAFSVPNDIKLDGDIKKYKQDWYSLCDRATGEIPKLNRTDFHISFSEDKKTMYIAVTCYEKKMGKIKAETKLNDTAKIFDDDVVEVYINTPDRSYFKIVVNPNGAVWDESTDVSIIERDTLGILWNPGIKANVKKFDNRWTVELMIPTKDFGKNSPTEQFPWGIQVARTRFAEGYEEWALGPGLGAYAEVNLWGNLW